MKNFFNWPVLSGLFYYCVLLQHHAEIFLILKNRSEYSYSSLHCKSITELREKKTIFKLFCIQLTDLFPSLYPANKDHQKNAEKWNNKESKQTDTNCRIWRGREKIIWNSKTENNESHPNNTINSCICVFDFFFIWPIFLPIF